MKRTLDDILAGIPGWKGAAATQLIGGLTNNTWKISKGDRSGVLKIDESPRQAPLNTRDSEAQVQRNAAAVGLANDVLYVDELVIVSEFAEGAVWSRASFDIAGNLERLAAALQRLHALPLTGRVFDATLAAKNYAAAIGNWDAGLVRLCTQVVTGRQSPRNLSCCHNDLVAENIIGVPELRFLDWEYACDNDPLFDLATVVEHHELSETQVEQLLNAYFGRDGQRWRSQLAEHQTFYLALLWLWTASRPDANSVELGRVAERVLTSCF